jgi:hypothetical protein
MGGACGAAIPHAPHAYAHGHGRGGSRGRAVRPARPQAAGPPCPLPAARPTWLRDDRTGGWGSSAAGASVNEATKNRRGNNRPAVLSHRTLRTPRRIQTQRQTQADAGRRRQTQAGAEKKAGSTAKPSAWGTFAALHPRRTQRGRMQMQRVRGGVQGVGRSRGGRVAVFPVRLQPTQALAANPSKKLSGGCIIEMRAAHR